MEIPKELNNEIWDYCRANNIPNIDDFIVKLVKQGFTVEKFGATPQTREKIVEKVVEKIVEVPVEKVIEKIIEVPIQMVDNEMSESLKNSILKVSELTGQLNDANSEIENLKKNLEIEKSKKKFDIYGEQ